MPPSVLDDRNQYSGIRKECQEKVLQENQQAMANFIKQKRKRTEVTDMGLKKKAVKKLIKHAAKHAARKAAKKTAKKLRERL